MSRQQNKRDRQNVIYDPKMNLVLKKISSGGIKGDFFAYLLISLITGRPRGRMALSSSKRLAILVCQSKVCPISPYFDDVGSDTFQFNTVYGAKFVAESLCLRECSRNRVFHWNPYGHRCRLAPWQWQSYCLLVFCPPLGLAACGRADLSVPTEQAY